MKRSTAATTAAASSGEAPGATIVSLGRRFIEPRVSCSPGPVLPVLDHDAVLAAVSPAEALESWREGRIEAQTISL
jgi:hypothetical protein